MDVVMEDSASTCVSRMRIHDDGISLQLATDRARELDQECISRSGLLNDLVNNSHPSEEIFINVSEKAMRLWLGQSPLQGTGAADRDKLHVAVSTAGYTLDELLLLIMAADVLIDDKTLSHAARGLARFVTAEFDANPTKETHNARIFAALPDHLLLAVLTHAPLRGCLLHLPPAHHASALHAHYPSIDAHHTLRLQNLTPPTLSAALTASAAFSALQHVSLAGETLPRDGNPLAALLTAVTALTHLDLSACALGAAAAATLRDALPLLPGLRSLDLSTNEFDWAIARDIAEGLAGCSTLETLNVLRTVKTDDPQEAGPGWLQMAGAALAPLTALTAISIGTYDPRRVEGGSDALCHGLLALLDAAADLPTLAALHVGLICPEITEGKTVGVARALARMTALRRLKLDAPLFFERRLGPQYGMMAVQLGQETKRQSLLGRALAHLSALTALDVSTVDLTPSPAQALALLARLRALRSLRSLAIDLQLTASLLTFTAGPQQLAAVAELLPCLDALTALALTAAVPHCTSGEHTIARTASPIAVAEAAAALPALRELHLPVSTERDHAADLVATLRSATQVTRLTLDLFVRGTDSGHNCSLLAPYLRLFRYVRTLNVHVPCGPKDWLVPVIGGVKRMRQLCSLSVVSDDAHPAAAAIVDAAAVMRGLEDVCIGLPLAEPWVPMDGSAPPLADFVSALPQLTSLTSMQWSLHMHGVLGDGGSAVQPLLSLLEACTGLTGLQALSIQPFDVDARAACAMLARLRLRTLLLALREASAVGAIADMVVRMPSLRTVVVADGGCREYLGGHLQLDKAAESLPACKLYF